MAEHFAPLTQPAIPIRVSGRNRHSPLRHGPDPDVGGWAPTSFTPLTEPHIAPVANPLWATGPLTGGSSPPAASRAWPWPPPTT